MDEFVEGFTNDGELTPIDIVAEITGLTYDEIRSCSEIVIIPDVDDSDDFFNNLENKIS